jgi:uncharacterized protein (DUF1015 family)
MRIEPLRGLRYGIGRARDVSAVVAPPYDQISPEQQERLHALDPHNIVRLTLPRSPDYGAARAVLDAWLADGAWTPEAEPAVYPYAQTYRVGGVEVTRTGVVALGEVTDYARGIVRPHERTHAGPKRDRLALLEATGADIGLLFMLASDPDGALREAAAPHGEPVAEARDLRGERHTLWRLTDPARIARLQKVLADRRAIIADGHHRYETAVEYARRRPDAALKLMAFFALEAPGLTILPNHRLVHGLDPARVAGLAEAARPWFDAAPLPDPGTFTPSNRRLGVVTAQAAFALTLREGAEARIDWPAGTSARWRALAVSILHEGVLRPLLGITDAHLDARTHVDYTADGAEAIARARAGRDQAAFLIAPTTPEELLAVVEGGERLPQKSTHFYPKLLDGLVFALVR